MSDSVATEPPQRAVASDPLLGLAVHQGERWALAYFDSGDWMISRGFVTDSPEQTMKEAAVGMGQSWTQIVALGFRLVRISQVATITAVLSEK